MGFINLQIPVSGALNATEDPKIAANFTTLETLLNGELDSTNLASSAGIALGQLAAGVARLNVRPTAGDLVIGNGDLAQVTTGGPTITLPAPTGISIAGVIASPTASGTNLTHLHAHGTETILSSVAGPGTVSLGTPYATMVVVSDGVNWFVLSGRQDTGWVPLTLPGSWTVATGFAAPAARLIGDRVWLRGGTTNGTGGASSFSAPFPAGMTPPANIQLPVVNSGAFDYLVVTSGTNLTSSLGVSAGGSIVFSGSYGMS